MRRRVRSHRRVWTAIRIRCVFRPRFHSRKRVEAELANLPLASNFRLPRPASGDADRPRQVWTTLAPNPHVFVWVDSRKSGIVAADVRRLTLKKTNGTEPPYVGCYGFLNRPDIFVERKRNDFAPRRFCFNLPQEARKNLRMQTIRLGKSSLIGSRLSYGCWRIAGAWEAAKVTPEVEANGQKAVIAAFEAGYTLFDLADIYCESVCERIFGRALQAVPGMRKGALIATKCGIRRRGDPNPDSPYRYDFSAEHIVRSCEQSLQRLGVETVDLYLLHRPDYLGDPATVAEAFSNLRQSGKVREFGVSNFRPSQLAALQKTCPMRLAVNQVEISLMRLDCLHDGTLDQCLAEEVTPMAWSPLGGGRLAVDGPID